MAGHYVYIETSAPRVLGDKARLISGSFQTSVDQCVEFWYHMYGRSTGSLNVYLKSGGNLGSPVFTKSGRVPSVCVIMSSGYIIFGLFMLAKISILSSD